MRTKKEYFILLGKNLQRLRKQKKWSQQQLANECDVDRAKISDIERANEDFHFNTILELCIALNIEPKELLDFTELEKQDAKL